MLLLAACGAAPRPALPPRGTVIAHALGAVDGLTYTNSVESLERSLSRGFRWLEADVALTADGRAVCLHEGLEVLLGLPRSLADLRFSELMGARLYGRLTPLSLQGLLERVQVHPGVVLFLDAGQLGAGRLAAIEDTIAAVDPALRKRLVIEGTSASDLELARQAERARGAFAAVVLATSYLDESPRAVAELVRRQRVPGVLVPAARFRPSFATALHDAGALVIVHTVNDPMEIGRLLEAGADAVMSDFLGPDSVPTRVPGG
jgi:glycerophosphoryl diester phosphodiesterase